MFHDQSDEEIADVVVSAMMIPSLTFWKNPTAIAPKINKGLEAFENDNSRSASIREISFFFRSKTVIFAPDGKPLTMPNIQAKLPTPRTLNNGRMTGSTKRRKIGRSRSSLTVPP